MSTSLVFCATFADGIKTRMSCAVLDAGRGERMARIAWSVRTKQPETAAVLLTSHFERNGQSVMPFELAASNARWRYFSDTGRETVELEPRLDMMRNAEFEQRFPGVKGKRADSFSRYVSYRKGTKEVLPVTRSIDYKKNPSLHACDARCQNARGKNCECSCGGKNHGRANAFTCN